MCYVYQDINHTLTNLSNNIGTINSVSLCAPLRDRKFGSVVANCCLYL